MKMTRTKVLLLVLLWAAMPILAQEEAIIEAVEEEQPPSSIKKKGVKVFGDYGQRGIKNFDTGEVLLAPEYYSISQNGQFFVIAINKPSGNKSKGVFNAKTKKVTIPCKYDDITIKTRGPKDKKEYYFILEYGKAYEIMGPDYTALIAGSYDGIQFENTYLRLQKGKKYGIYFFRNSKQTPIQYDFISNYRRGGILHGNILSIKEGKNYLFDSTGKLLVKKSMSFHPVPRQWEGEYRTSWFVVSNDKGHMGVFDAKEKKVIISGKYSAVPQSLKNHFIIKKKGKFGVVTSTNEVLIPFKYDTIAFLAPPNVLTHKNIKNKYIDPEQLQYPFLLAGKKGKFGLINEKNETITPFVYQKISHLYGAYKACRQSNECEFLDEKGKPTTDEQYEDIGQCYNGICAVFRKGKVSYVNLGGKLLEGFKRPTEVHGYSGIELLFQKYEEALRSDSDTVLMAFAKALTPDRYSMEFMRRVPFNYRGIPIDMDHKGITVKKLVESNFQQLLRFREQLKRRGHLKDLQFIRIDRPGCGYEDFGRYQFLVNETYGIFKSGDQKYRYKLGELIKIDGYWKSFTQPRKL